MPFFKIINHNREIKKAVLAENYEDFIKQGCAKLNISQSLTVKAVLEEDGTEIDDWSLLIICAGKQLMILGDGECYTSPNTSSSNFSSSFECQNGETFFFNNDALCLDATTSGNISSAIKQINGYLDTVHSPRELMMRKAIELPEFSNYTEAKLNEGKPMAVFSKIVNELAYGLLPKYNMTTKSEYETVGQLMFTKYPCIQVDRTTKVPWKYLTEKLSAKIRHIRWFENSKLKRHRTYGVNKKLLKLAKEVEPTCTVEIEMPEMTYENALLELIVVFNEAELDIPKILKLNRLTHKQRRKWMLESNVGVDEILKKFPHFADVRFLEPELDLILKVSNSKKTFLENFAKLYDFLEDHLELAQDEESSDHEDRSIALVKFLELNLSTNVGRVKCSKKRQKSNQGKKKSEPFSIMNMTNNEIQVSTLDAPQIVTVGKSNKREIFIVSNDIKMKCNFSLSEAIFALLACYYVFDLSYPAVLTQVLGFYQEFILSDCSSKSNFKKSPKYLEFLEKFDINELFKKD